MSTRCTNQDWFESEDLWRRWHPFGFSERALEEAVKQVEGMISLMGIEPGAHVLDLCCGIGRHGLEFAKRGFSVTGVDRTQIFLNEARARFAAAEREGEFVREDMRRFRRESAFDAAYNFFTSFGYFEDEAEQRQVLQNLHDSLNPGGVLLLDTMGKEIIARNFREKEWNEHEGVIMCAEHSVTDNWRYSLAKWTFIEGDRRQDFEIKIRCYSAVELIDLLTSIGFTNIRAYGDIHGAHYDQNATRLVVVARKPS